MAPLEDSVQFLKGVGPRKAELLHNAGIDTVGDLIFWLPFRYEDRRRFPTVSAARIGEEGSFLGAITGVREVRPRGRRGRAILNATFSDESGHMALVWFNQAAYFKKVIAGAERWLVYGRVEASRRGGLQLVHPDIEAVGESEDPAALARILPVYHKPTDISQAAMRSFVARAVEANVTRARSGVPEPVRKRMGLCPLADALRFVHSPPPDADLSLLAAAQTDSHKALIFEELFVLQAGILLRKAQRSAERGLIMPAAPEGISEFLSLLPFEPTGAQRRVMAEVSKDMAGSQPMNRLVQGDVGSGKTVVAYAAILQAVRAGYQAALMAPTELLAEQHFATITPWARAQGIKTALLSGQLGAAEARSIRDALEAGDLDLVVGTHALVQESTRFRSLGLAVIDEQHRFGVLQRAALKGSAADTLLLSATPIPRTLSLVLFGDLDVSALDEMPKGRKPVVTRVIRSSARPRLLERMAAAMSEGRQCYIVYPLVEESEKLELADATSMAESLQSGAFKSFRVGLLHGRMKAEEKDAVMRRFKAGDLDVLVATTVIEVGIDVPNASIMVVEHPERFGLAQLHQLRGRVGRGADEGFCCLVAGPEQSPESLERLRIMETTSDGFDVAEADLRLRGPGEYIGTRQSGAPGLSAANLVRDVKTLEMAREEADVWLRDDPGLSQPESRMLRHALEKRWGDRLSLAEVG